MAIDFEELSDKLLGAFTDPDEKQRRKRLDQWYKKAIPIVQAAVPNEIRRDIESILAEDRPEAGWQHLREKWHRDIIMLSMEIRLKNMGARPEPLPMEVAGSNKSWFRRMLARLKLS